MAKNSMKPQIRFKGFTDAWEQRKFGSIVYRTNEMSDTDGLPRVEYEDIEAGQGTLNKYLKEKVSTKKGIVFQYGDILYGKLRPYLKNWLFVFFSGIAVGDFWVLRSNLVSHSFIYRLVQTPAFDYIANQSTGSKMPRADWNLVSNSKFTLPLSAEEQEAIGQIFLKLDNLITLHQRKYEKFVNIKKALLEKMFPQGDEKVPRIRFKGFTDAWEQRKLGEISRTTIGEFVIRTKQNDNSPYPVYNGGTSFTGFYEEFNNEGNKIVVSARGANAGFVNVVKTRYWAGNSCYSVDLLDKIHFDTDFIYHEMKRTQSRFLDNQQAANIPSVSKTDVEKFNIDLPQVDEQKRISKFFDQIDNLITLHQRQVEKLKNIKSALLEKMFV